MNNVIPRTVAARLALGYGALMVGSMTVIAVLFYFGTVGVLSERIDIKMTTISLRLVGLAQTRGIESLKQEIQRLLDDGIDSDTEVYFLGDSYNATPVYRITGWDQFQRQSGTLDLH